MRIDSKIMQMAESKKGVLYICDEIKSDGYDFWNGKKIVSETSEQFIRDRLSEFEGVSELDIHISSCGGSVKVAMGLYAQIKAFACPKKTAYIDGMAASAATVVAMAADEVVMPLAGLMMIHDAWIDRTSGNAEELRKTADDLDVITSASRTAYLQHSGGKISEEELTSLMRAEAWLTAAQCHKYGLCDRISDASEDAEGEALQSAAASYFAKADIRLAAMLSRIEARLEVIEKAVCAEKKDEGAEEEETPPEDAEQKEKPAPAMSRADVLAAAVCSIGSKRYINQRIEFLDN